MDALILQKTCQSCGAQFQCCAGDCWCDDVPVSDGKRIEMRQYSDCLCPACLAKPAATPAQ